MNIPNISIRKDAVSAVLRKRWIACYMMYDWNYYHADCVFQSNEIERYQKTCGMLDKLPEALPETGKQLTETYNRVLLEDVEDFIRSHMEVCGQDRREVELQMARAEAAVFEEVVIDEP